MTRKYVNRVLGARKRAGEITGTDCEFCKTTKARKETFPFCCALCRKQAMNYRAFKEKNKDNYVRGSNVSVFDVPHPFPVRRGD